MTSHSHLYNISIMHGSNMSFLAAGSDEALVRAQKYITDGDWAPGVKVVAELNQETGGHLYALLTYIEGQESCQIKQIVEAGN